MATFPPPLCRGRLTVNLTRHAETHAFAVSVYQTVRTTGKIRPTKKTDRQIPPTKKEISRPKLIYIKCTHPVTRFLESLPLGVWSVSVERHPGVRAPGNLVLKAEHSVLRRHVRVYTARFSTVSTISCAGGGGGRKEKIIGRIRRERDENRQTRESGLRETGSRCCWRGTSLPLTK